MVLEACQSSESLDVVLDLKDFQLRHSARLCNLAHDVVEKHCIGMMNPRSTWINSKTPS